MRQAGKGNKENNISHVLLQVREQGFERYKTKVNKKNKKCSNFLFFFPSPPHRTPQTAVRQESWCATSIRAVDTAASSTMSYTASWSLTAPSARSSWSPTTGATPPAAGRPSSCPSVTPAPTALEPPLDTGQVGPQTRSYQHRTVAGSMPCDWLLNNQITLSLPRLKNRGRPDFVLLQRKTKCEFSG